MATYTAFMQADPAVSALKQRLSQGFDTKGWATGANSTTRLDGIGGVWAQPSSLEVQAQASPNMTTRVFRGMAKVPGLENIAQGMYGFASDATINVTHAAAHATLYYIDAVVVRVKDQSYSGGVILGEVVAVRGTAATIGAVAPPSAGTIGNSYIVLGHVTIRPATSSVLNTDIADRRHWLTAPGGISILRSFEESDAQILTGEAVYRKKALNTYDAVLGGYRGVSNIPKKSTTFDNTTHIDSYVVASLVITDPGYPYRIKSYGSIIWSQGINIGYDVHLRLTNQAGTVVNAVAGFTSLGLVVVSTGISRQITGMSDVLTGTQTICICLIRTNNTDPGSGVTVDTASAYNHFMCEIIPEPPA
jgi:hypothetical protein